MVHWAAFQAWARYGYDGIFACGVHGVATRFTFINDCSEKTGYVYRNLKLISMCMISYSRTGVSRSNDLSKEVYDGDFNR